MKFRPAKWGLQSQVALQKFRAADVCCGSEATFLSRAGDVAYSLVSNRQSGHDPLRLCAICVVVDLVRRASLLAPVLSSALTRRSVPVVAASGGIVTR